MSEIVLQFSTQGDILSHFINIFDHGFWATHVDTVLPGGRLLGARYDGGVMVREADYTRFSRTVIVRLPAPQPVVDAYMGFLQEQLGKPYDTLAIEAFVLGRDWRDDDKWFCDELVFAGLERSGFLTHPLPTGISRLTPSDLMLVCSQYTDVTGGDSAEVP